MISYSILKSILTDCDFVFKCVNNACVQVNFFETVMLVIHISSFSNLHYFDSS